jgi:hypothetical protein
MKHLKRFNESNEDIISVCKDILLQLSDDGFDPYVMEMTNGDIIIDISGQNDNYCFKNEDLEETLSRMEYYLNEEGYSEKEYINKVHKYWNEVGYKSDLYNPNGRDWRDRLNSGQVQTTFRIIFKKNK